MPRIRAASIDEHKALTRRALLDAARELIEESGTAEISLGEVALAAGVGRTTFYDYFSDRDDVIASLVEDELPHVIAELIGTVDRELPVPSRLATLVARTVEFVVSDPVFGVILHREVGRMGQDAQRRIAAAHSDLSIEMAMLYTDGTEQGIFDPLPPRLAGHLIQDTIMAAAKVLIEGGGTVDVGEITTSLERFLLRGLGYRADER